MSEAVQIELIKALPSILTVLVALVIAWLTRANGIKTEANSLKVDEYHHEVNNKMDIFLKTLEQLADARVAAAEQGFKAKKDAETKE